MEQYPGNPIPPNPPIFDIEKVAAATECTGLVPSAIESEDVAENYTRLYGIHWQRPTEVGKKNKE